jgi:hypothetical protein
VVLFIGVASNAWGFTPSPRIYGTWIGGLDCPGGTRARPARGAGGARRRRGRQ